MPGRFRSLDALRGLAALAVVFYHVQGAFDRAAQPWMPEALRAAFKGGHYGVNVFFVLSGFVIAYSVRDGHWTPGYFVRFALRRSLRLDPPYWVAIALELGLMALGAALFPGLGQGAVPSVPALLAHLVYLQDILGYGHFIAIFWTLCYEFQFYLLFVGCLVAWEALARLAGRRVATVATGALFAALFLLSVAVHHGHVGGVPRGLALDRWHQFFAGVLAWWVAAGRLPRGVLPVAWLVIGALATRADTGPELAIVVGTSVVCLLGVSRPDFDRRFAWRPLQFLGAISYSLYLYHASVGWRVVSVAQAVAGRSLPPVLGILAWLGALAAALVVAWIGWRFVETPSLALARRVALPRRAGAHAGDAVLSGSGAAAPSPPAPTPASPPPPAPPRAAPPA